MSSESAGIRRFSLQVGGTLRDSLRPPHLRQSPRWVLQASHQFAHHWEEATPFSVPRAFGAVCRPPRAPANPGSASHGFRPGFVQNPSLERPAISDFLLFVKMGLGFCVYFSCEGPGVPPRRGAAEHYVGNQASQPLLLPTQAPGVENNPHPPET